MKISNLHSKLTNIKKLWCIFEFCPILIVFPSFCYPQYNVNGNANRENCNCYVLTPAKQFQSGSVLQKTQITLNDSFDFSFNVYLGCLDSNGADGIVFILQSNDTSVGEAGQGLGFQGINPSVGISVDTYQNFDNNDPSYDHISIQANGNITHGNDLAGPIPASSMSDNIEDCNWHILRVKWDPVTHTLSTFFDGVFRLSTQTDLVGTIFHNEPLVYWGFSGATGNVFNLQKFCTPLNLFFNSNLTNDATCLGTPVIFMDSSVSFSAIKSYYWDFGDGKTSTLAFPPPHNYLQTGNFQAKHSITTVDDCTSDTVIKTIVIGDKPAASFNIYDTCITISPRLENNTSVNTGTIAQWSWKIDGNDLPNTEYPDLSMLEPGSHSLELIATSNIGCVSTPVTKKFIIEHKPEIVSDVNTGCANVPVSFNAEQTDSLTKINLWQWDFGDTQMDSKQNTNHVYLVKGYYQVELKATGSNGCIGIFSKNIFINKAHAFAGNDTTVISNTPFQLTGTGGVMFAWSPSTGLDNSKISNPVGNVKDDIRYFLTVTTTEGCTDTSSIKINVFKGSAIYVPTAFTPNNDGLNDILKPLYIGIKSLSYFTIYNRWGQNIFSTRKLNVGWDGSLKGQNLDAGTFVWILKATDLVGRVYVLKGTFMLLR